MITIDKSTASESGNARVTFSMPGSACNDCLYLVGWFDEWDQSVYRMQREADGTWSLTLELEAGCEYHYRFRTADGRWLDDPSVRATSPQPGLNRSFVVSRDIGLSAPPS
jgi:1,4-alpha-glucan branching enzyme